MGVPSAAGTASVQQGALREQDQPSGNKQASIWQAEPPAAVHPDARGVSTAACSQAELAALLAGESSGGCGGMVTKGSAPHPVCCPLCSSLWERSLFIYVLLFSFLTFKKKCICFATLGFSRGTRDLQAALRHAGILFAWFLSPLPGHGEWPRSILCSHRCVAPGTVLSTFKL